MKRKLENRIKRLEQIVDPEPYLNPVLIYDPKKPIPPIPSHVRVVIPDNGRDKMPRLSEEERKKIEFIVQQREIEKIEKNIPSDEIVASTSYLSASNFLSSAFLFTRSSY